MSEYVEIFCLNKRHSDVVINFLYDLHEIIDNATYYEEDFVGFTDIMEDFIVYHNKLGEEAVKGSVEYKNWYSSLGNNVYWATKGYFAAMQDKESAIINEKKVISLIQDFLDNIELALIIDPNLTTNGRINLN
jgi:hypothetical protein